MKLTDFGVSRSNESQHLTTVGGIIGTPSYFAPELLQDAEASPITDCYALAVTAFEAFTGTLPFMGDSVASTRLRIVNEPPAIPPGMDPRVKAVFLRAFVKRPSDRFSDVYEFMGAWVDERGHPSVITVLEGVLGIFGFNEEAISVAKRTTYAPATKGGIAQRETIEVVYVFKAGR